jgi:SAM-dependent methyltransferase
MKAAESFNKFDKWGGGLDENERERIAKVFSLIPKDVGFILDLGCGDGRITNKLLGFERVVGLDFSKVALKHVKADHILASCTNTPFRKNSFDLVLTTEVLEHLNNEVYERTLREVEWLSPRYIIVGVPYKQNLRDLLCKCLNCGYIYLPSSDAGEHVRSLNGEKLTTLLSRYTLDSIVYCRKGRSDPLLRMKHLLGYYYTNSLAKCPKCGSSKQFSRRKDLLYRIISHISWRIGRRIPVWTIVRYSMG